MKVENASRGIENRRWPCANGSQKSSKYGNAPELQGMKGCMHVLTGACF